MLHARRPDPCLAAAEPVARPARIGMDLVQVAAIERSVADFGARFTTRIFAPGELRAATVDGRLDVRALAARFAAKEAAIKAFGLPEAGVAWSQIEVQAVAGDASANRIVLTGRAAEAVAACGRYEIAVALSHREGMACAIVVALPAREE
jgi:holo-[acyl-carrier protein] synthase